MLDDKLLPKFLLYAVEYIICDTTLNFILDVDYASETCEHVYCEL